MTALFSVVFLILDPFGFYRNLATYALPDIFVTSMIFIALMILFYSIKKGSIVSLCLSSCLIGLATSAKMNGLLGIIPLITCSLFFRTTFYPIQKTVFFVMLSALIGFFAGSPAILTHLNVYIPGFEYEKALLIGNTAGFDATRSPWWAFQHFFNQNPAFSIFLIFVFVYVILKPKRWQVSLLVSFWIGFFILATLAKRSEAYFLAIYPMIFLMINEVIFDILKSPSKKLFSFFTSVTIIIMTFASFQQFYFLLGNEDNRITAKKWISNEIPTGSHFLLEWGYFPELFIQPIGVKNWRTNLKDDKSFQKTFVTLNKDNIYSISMLSAIDHQVEKFFKNGTYLITSSTLFGRYVNRKPRFSELSKRSDDYLEEYDSLRDFYLTLITEQTPFQMIKIFDQGIGPDVYIFKFFKNEAADEDIAGINS